MNIKKYCAFHPEQGEKIFYFSSIKKAKQANPSFKGWREVE